MKKIGKWSAAIGLLFVVGLMFSSLSFADDTKQFGGWLMGTPITSQQGFQGTEAMITEEGTVQKIEKMKGVPDGLQMTIKTAQGNSWVVFLGPKWFVDNQRIKFAAKDKVEARGKKFENYIIASEVSKGEWTMKLRNEEDGFPNWDCCFPRKAR